MSIKELFEWVASVLGLQDAPGYAICLTIIISVLLFVVSKLWIAHSSHKEERRRYEYARSQEVNTRRYQEELSAAKSLAGKFMSLRFATHKLRCCPDSLFCDAEQNWRAQYEDACIELGRNAPVLNLRTLSTGAPTCGVHVKDISKDESLLIDLDAIGRPFDFGKGDNISADSRTDANIKIVSCRASLYLKGIQFLNQCALARLEAIEERGNDGIIPDEPLIIYTPEDHRYKFPAADYSKPPHFIDDDIDARLGLFYRNFANCAFCRIRNSDTGQRDARRINHQNARRARFAEIFPRMHRYDRECPHPLYGTGDQIDRKSGCNE